MSKQHRHCCWLVLKTMYLQFVWVNSLMVIKDNVNLYAGRDSSWKWIMFWRWYWCSSVLFLAKWRKLLNNSWYRGISFLLLELIQSMLGLFYQSFQKVFIYLKYILPRNCISFLFCWLKLSLDEVFPTWEFWKGIEVLFIHYPLAKGSISFQLGFGDSVTTILVVLMLLVPVGNTDILMSHSHCMWRNFTKSMEKWN